MSNGGTGTLSYSASDNAAWLSVVARRAARRPAALSVSVNAAGLARRHAHGQRDRSPRPGRAARRRSIPVTLTVAPAGGQLLGGANVIGTDTSSAQVGGARSTGSRRRPTGTATQLRLYVDGASSATRLVLGLYGDANGTADEPARLRLDDDGDARRLERGHARARRSR